MKVLVTGGTGAVGINIVRRLAAEGHQVGCLSRRANEDEPLREWFLQPVRERVRIAEGDIADLDRLNSLFDELRPTHVVHAAAITPTSEMERGSAPLIINTNLMGTVNVLDAARRSGVRRVVFISSAAVYGETDESSAITEEAPLRPVGLYSIAKEASEKLCVAYTRLHSIETVALRVGWVYGPMERPMKSSRSNMSLVYQFVHLALRGEEISVAHLDHVRDWIHADDLAGAVSTVLDQPSVRRGVYNVSGGVGYSHRQVLEALRQILPLRYRQVDAPQDTNVAPSVTGKRRGPVSIGHLVGDTSYRLRFDLHTGLRDYVAWVRSAQSCNPAGT